MWSDTRIEAELCEFLRGHDEWPSYADFVRGGHKALRDAVTHHGGAHAWAVRLGLPYVERPPGTAVRWTEQRIRTELEQFLGSRDDWPSYAEFEAAGRRPLRQAIARTGGCERWARELRVGRDTLRAGSRRVWDDRRIERAVAPLVAALGRWPTKSEFRDAGLSSVLTAIHAHRGAPWWRERLGVSFAPPRRGVPDRLLWTDLTIEQALRRFCAGREEWPTARQFAEAGLARVYRAASLHGGIPHWRARLGM
jgi:hypothetical protein